MSDRATATASEFLLGAAAIARELQELGLIDEDVDPAVAESRVYYLASGRSKSRLPIGRFGKSLIAHRAKLHKAAHALTD
jgi:hypothetical protein